MNNVVERPLLLCKDYLQMIEFIHKLRQFTVLIQSARVCNRNIFKQYISYYCYYWASKEHHTTSISILCILFDFCKQRTVIFGLCVPFESMHPVRFKWMDSGFPKITWLVRWGQWQNVPLNSRTFDYHRPHGRISKIFCFRGSSNPSIYLLGVSPHSRSIAISTWSGGSI